MPVSLIANMNWTTPRKVQLLKLMNKEEMENLGRPITSKEIELRIKNFPTEKIPGQKSFT